LARRRGRPIDGRLLAVVRRRYGLVVLPTSWRMSARPGAERNGRLARRHRLVRWTRSRSGTGMRAGCRLPTSCILGRQWALPLWRKARAWCG